MSPSPRRPADRTARRRRRSYFSRRSGFGKIAGAGSLERTRPRLIPRPTGKIQNAAAVFRGDLDLVAYGATGFPPPKKVDA